MFLTFRSRLRVAANVQVWLRSSKMKALPWDWHWFCKPRRIGLDVRCHLNKKTMRYPIALPLYILWIFSTHCTMLLYNPYCPLPLFCTVSSLVIVSIHVSSLRFLGSLIVCLFYFFFFSLGGGDEVVVIFFHSVSQKIIWWWRKKQKQTLLS